MPFKNRQQQLEYWRTYDKRRPRRVLTGSQKLRVRLSQLLVKFGIDQVDYEMLLMAQGGRCAICDTDEPGRDFKHFNVDHDHATNSIRGLLCSACNRAIGLLKDSPELVAKAAHYLRTSSAEFGPHK